MGIGAYHSVSNVTGPRVPACLSSSRTVFSWRWGELANKMGAVTYLTRRGIYAIAMGDEAMQVLNLEAGS